jgi:hypothetical protein
LAGDLAVVVEAEWAQPLPNAIAKKDNARKDVRAPDSITR